MKKEETEFNTSNKTKIILILLVSVILLPSLFINKLIFGGLYLIILLLLLFYPISKLIFLKKELIILRPFTRQIIKYGDIKTVNFSYTDDVGPYDSYGAIKLSLITGKKIILSYLLFSSKDIKEIITLLKKRIKTKTN